MTQTLPPDIPVDFALKQTQVILYSYKKWLGKDLIASKNAQDDMLKLYYAPFVVMSSNNANDPILTYGNQRGLSLWEMSWEKLTQTPGRHTAEAMHRDQRQEFLETVEKNGFVKNYSGIRISNTGKRFEIHQAIVWNLTNEKNEFLGQAATFNQWNFL